ncbi:uncharacterized protein [Dysidea avara]|uniref:uncharacterized protein isoform X2 n=1 Tax=Dysidea avara TaxID=196820 RepID=UPI00331A323C
MCSECGKGYSRNYRLQKHCQEDHALATSNKRSKRFDCPMCTQKSFFTLLEMRRHCELEHQNDLGTTVHEFETPSHFTRWKEAIEEESFVYYTKEKEYKPSEGDVVKWIYYVCCRDGDYRQCTKPRTTGKKRPHQKDSKKLNDTCISRIYADYYNDDHVTATHVTAHTNHTPGPHEDTYLPLPKNIKFAVAVKLSHGIPAERIMEGHGRII